MPPKIRLNEFIDRDAVIDSIQGTGPRGAIAARATHEGIIVSGNIPRATLPPQMLLSGGDDFDEDKLAAQQQQQQQVEQILDEAEAALPPSKSLAWLHKLIEEFFEFRARQFQIKGGAPLAFALSDEDDRATRMIVPSAITDDVAFHLFELISERYGVPTVVAQHCETALKTAKYFAARDVTAALFFALLKTPTFDSNDVRFVVEARKCMRSSLVSQRGVDGVLRWFIPLRSVPHVLRKATEHPWARQVLPKIHSAFETLFRVQQHKTREQQQQQQQQGNGGRGGPLFTMPSPQNLKLVPPFAADHPLVGRGPFVDVRGNEAFLASQPPQLVIGADYLLCMLFVNWLDHRDEVLACGAAGRPLTTITNRRTGRVSAEKTIDPTWKKLEMFAMDIDDAGNFAHTQQQQQQQRPERQASMNSRSTTAAAAATHTGDSGSDSHGRSGSLPQTPLLTGAGAVASSSPPPGSISFFSDNSSAINSGADHGSPSVVRSGPQHHRGKADSAAQRSVDRQAHAIKSMPPRVLHLYTKQQ